MISLRLWKRQLFDDYKSPGQQADALVQPRNQALRWWSAPIIIDIGVWLLLSWIWSGPSRLRPSLLTSLGADGGRPEVKGSLPLRVTKKEGKFP